MESRAIMTLRAMMPKMEKTTSLLAQSRSLSALLPVRARNSQVKPRVAAAARKLVPVYPQKVSSKVTAEKTVIERRMCLRATATPRLTGKTGMAADL